MIQLPSRSELKSAFEDLKSFLKNPVQQLKHVPEWNWPTAIAMSLIFSAIIGAATGAFMLRIGAVIRGAIIYPISSLFVLGVFTVFFYYSFLFFFRLEAPVKKLFILCFLAAIPWLVVAPLVDYVPPLSPIGIILTGLLAVVGFSENFRIDRRSATKLVGAIVGVFLLFWIINLIRVSQFEDPDAELITPESLEIIEKELDTE